MTKPTLTLVIAAVALAAGLAGWTLRGGDRTPLVQVATDGLSEAQQTAMLEARTKGDSNAPIVVFEASDFQCPYCRVFWEETLPFLDTEYVQTSKIRFTFLNFPLYQIHPNATAAHEFAMCAAMQDKFWPVHDLLYRYQAEWAHLADPAPYFGELADSAGLEADELKACLEGGVVRGLIQQEAQLNWRAGVQSTPSFIIDNHLLAGAAPIDAWRPILDSIFAEKTGG